MTGPILAKLVETMVGALNSREIPTAGSILEHFNRELVEKVRAWRVAPPTKLSCQEKAALAMWKADLSFHLWVVMPPCEGQMLLAHIHPDPDWGGCVIFNMC
jgi:hypothetical protein